MNGFALVLVAATLGVDYGWQPSSDGRLEYIIQVEPVTLIALREGQEVLSQIDPYVKHVRRFRIRVGSELVPRVGSPPREGGYGSTPPASSPPQAGVSYGWQPYEANSLEFIVQISPERLVLLKNGEDIVGELPAEIQHVGRFRVRSASDQLPRQGLGGTATASSGVSLASANQPQPSGQQTAQAPHFAEANPGVQTTGATQLGSANGAANTVPHTVGQPVSPQYGVGPTVNAPPRLGVSQNNSAGQSPAGSSQGATARFLTQASQNQASGGQTTYGGQATYSGSSPTIGNDQSDSRFIYQQTRGQSGPTGYTTSTQNASAGQGGGWQQPAVQPVAQPTYQSGQPAVQSIQPQPPSVANSAGGWSASGGSSQGWTPTPRENPSSAPQASQGGYGGWDTRATAANPPNPPAGQYGSGTAQYGRGAGQYGSGASQYGSGQPAASHDYLAPAGGPIYNPNAPSPYAGSPYVASGQSPGTAGQPPAATAGGYSPYSGPTFQASQEQSGRPAPPAISRPRGRDADPDLDWPLNTVSFGITNEKKANPLDFWNDLDATAADPTLAYLRGSGTSQAEEAWWPLTLAMLALFASMGGNLYMGWIAVDVYRKYLDVAADEYDDDDYQRSRRSRQEDDDVEDDEEDGWGSRRRRRRERETVGSDYS